MNSVRNVKKMVAMAGIGRTGGGRNDPKWKRKSREIVAITWENIEEQNCKKIEQEGKIKRSVTVKDASCQFAIASRMFCRGREDVWNVLNAALISCQTRTKKKSGCVHQSSTGSQRQKRSINDRMLSKRNTAKKRSNSLIGYPSRMSSSALAVIRPSFTR